MTFYSIVFGLVFVGAIRVVAAAWISAAYEEMVLGGLLALLIFNDTVYTTQYVEHHANEYDIVLKHIDFASALVLIAAMLQINPGDNFLFHGQQADSTLGIYARLPAIMELVLVYWLLACLWNSYDGRRFALKHVGRGERLLLVTFVLIALWAMRDAVVWWRGIIMLVSLAAMVVYMIIKLLRWMDVAPSRRPRLPATCPPNSCSVP